MSMVLPGVVGFKLTGKLRNGVTATDLVLTVTQMLRKHGVVGKFVEFYGGDMSELSLADRATIANMSPEYDATMGFFPVDGKTLDYLKLTGRSDDTVAMIESYLRANKMFVDYNQVEVERVYSSYLELNLEEVEPYLSGPKRPHDRVTLKNMKSDWLSCLDNNVGFKGFAVPKESQGKVAEFSFHGTPAKIKHGDVVIAAITSCTNTSNPNVMLGAALVAKKACELGLELVILGGIAMTVFLRTKMSHEDYEGGVIYLGVLFLGLVTHLFNGFAELAMSIVKLPIYYKQRDYCFYPSWIYALPTWILKIPISFVECAVWIAMTYYGIGFDPNIERFFRHYLVLVLVSQLASGLFRLLASLGREMVLADTFGSFAQLIMLALSGFIISRENIRKWWVWGYWASPLMYAQNLIAQNEFLGHKWNKTTDHSFSKDTLGVQILKARGIFVDPNWYWIGVGGLIAYILLF